MRSWDSEVAYFRFQILNYKGNWLGKFKGLGVEQKANWLEQDLKQWPSRGSHFPGWVLSLCVCVWFLAALQVMVAKIDEMERSPTKGKIAQLKGPFHKELELVLTEV